MLWQMDLNSTAEKEVETRRTYGIVIEIIGVTCLIVYCLVLKVDIKKTAFKFSRSSLVKNILCNITHMLSWSIWGFLTSEVCCLKHLWLGQWRSQIRILTMSLSVFITLQACNVAWNLTKCNVAKINFFIFMSFVNTFKDFYEARYYNENLENRRFATSHGNVATRCNVAENKIYFLVYETYLESNKRHF